MTPKELTIRFGIHQCIHWMIIGIMIPVITLIFQSRGLSLSDIGLVMAVWIGSTAIFEIPLGGVADIYGRRNTYVLSLLVSILGCIVLYYAHDLPLILIAAMLLGLSRAVYSGTLDAWFYDRFRHKQGDHSFHTALAKVSVMITIGLAIGSLIGGALPDSEIHSFFHLESIYDVNIILACVSNMLLILITFALIKEESKPATAQDKNTKTNVIHLGLQAIKVSLRHRVLSRLMQATIVFGMVLSSIENYWQPYLADIIQGTSYGVTVFGIISALYFLMSAASSLLSVRLLKWFNGSHKTLMLTTRAFGGIVFILLANTTQLWSFALCYLIFFFLFTAGNNSESVLLHENTEERVRSTMLSISSFMFTCGGVVASLFFGFLSEHYGISVSWIVSGILLVVSSAFFIYIPERSELKTA
ncbi:MAG: MFS transporter [Aliivibrio sp.]|uniref:MFS transporter n=1 Tax=Aliivibrio sp. TaxID=1872443 RepID=UPI001A458154|nr:MFS transporter [Aliivibrio sp.]